MVELKIMESYTRDVGRGVARIDYGVMDSLGVITGDVIKIVKTYCKALPLYPSDEGKSLLRVDGLVRNNAGVAIGDTVDVVKVSSSPALLVKFKPLEAIPPIDARYLADALESIVVVVGDHSFVPYFGGRLQFQIVGTDPKDIPVTINQKTKCEITSKDDDEDKSYMISGVYSALASEILLTRPKNLKSLFGKYQDMLDKLL